jgi:putative hydrolase of the HAD superfamily
MNGRNGARVRLLLFDLDETIAPDMATDHAVLDEIAADVAAEHGVVAERVAAAVLAATEPLWRQGQARAYCQRIGIDRWEGLWGPFGPSAEPMLAVLHAFVPTYRQEVWQRALAACGVGDAALARTLAARFAETRLARQGAYPWSRAALEALQPRYRLGMITNGAPDLQRLKLAGTGLAELFEPLVVSGELGVGKPEPAIFAHALTQAGATPDEAIMIGDSWERDVLGATGAGLRAVWVNPTGAAPPTPPTVAQRGRAPAVAAITAIKEIRDLRELAGTLDALG